MCFCSIQSAWLRFPVPANQSLNTQMYVCLCGPLEIPYKSLATVCGTFSGSVHICHNDDTSQKESLCQAAEKKATVAAAKANKRRIQFFCLEYIF